MEVVKEEKGSTVNVATGEAKVPNENGGTTSRQVGPKFIFEDTANNRKILADLFEKNGMHAEAAQLRGENYTPTLTGALKDFALDNTNLVKGLVTIAIGALTYYVSRKAYQFISKKMGWGTAVSATSPTDASSTENAKVTTFGKRVSPTQMTASA